MHPHRCRTYLVRCGFVAIAAIVLHAPSSATAQGKPAAAPMTADLQTTKAVLAKYSDPLAAIKDGYLSTLACIDFPAGAKDGPVEYPPGAMGVHFINMANIAPALDPSRPQVLIYEPRGDKLELVAAEWFMPEQAAQGKAPSIFGQTLNGPMDGHEPIMPASLRHYDLHVWLWKDNPRGMFTSTNADVKCAKGATYTVAVPGDHEAHGKH